MKRTLVVLAAALMAGCGADPIKTADATAEIKPVVEKSLVAWMTLDVTKVAPFYAKEATLAFYDISPLKSVGWEQYASESKKFLETCKSLKVKLNPDFKAYKNGNIAWVTSTTAIEVEPKTGDVAKVEGRLTQILEKRGENWIIVHEHSSMPPPVVKEKEPAKAAKKAAKPAAKPAAKRARKK